MTPPSDPRGGRATWAESLRRHVQDLRRRRPLPAAGDLTPRQDWQRRVNAGVLVRWLDECRAGFHAPERFAGGAPRGRIPAGPLLVFTSDITGLVAARAMIGAEPPLVCMLDEEYDALPVELSDPTRSRHIRFYSRFEPLEATRASTLRVAHPAEGGSEHWIHAEGTVSDARADRGTRHLWCWSDGEPMLLAEDLEELAIH